MNILIAEDTPIIQRLYQSLMENWGFNDIAINGQEAVEYAKNNSKKYDLCLMDVDMPIMNGLDAARIIRKQWITSLSWH
ncbi:response regulator [Microbulbifer sp.]|uniref:response regulator n=1 Tax=Microbulbifer sp. TaxID=1908541 RepID=UPI003F2F215F